MGDRKDQVEKGIEKAADKAKDVADKGMDKAKAAGKDLGERSRTPASTSNAKPESKRLPRSIYPARRSSDAACRRIFSDDRPIYAPPLTAGAGPA